MFQVDIIISNSDWNLIFFILVVGICFGTIFVYSFTGSLATNAFEQCSIDAYDVIWYRFPVQYQKYMIIILMESQKPQRFHGYQFAYINFETCMKIMRTACSYYILFKNFVK